MTLLCNQCQHENSNDAEKCVSCGAMLHNTLEMQGLPEETGESFMRDRAEYDEQLDRTTVMLEEDPDDLSTDEADATSLNPIIDIGEDETHATRQMPHMDDDDGLLHIGTVRFRGNLILTDKDTRTVYRIENHELDEAVIGRLNMKTGFRPQLDFTHADGKERGVSRRHATINQRGDLIFVTDHSSLNGTFLNGQRLVPEQARVMRDSDTLRVGHITLIVAFERI